MKTTEIIANLTERYGCDITTKQLKEYSADEGVSLATLRNRLAPYKVERGKYSLTERSTDEFVLSPRAKEITEGLEKLLGKKPPTDEHSLVPDNDPLYVPFGNFNDVKRIIKSKMFYPLFITGLSGNGKTHSVEQACAQLKRELVRVNITIETDEDDLLGGFRLADGNTVFHEGPVVDALKRGAVLLLDELDLASNKIMCLQSLLEGKGVYLKKINEYVKPAPGFTVIATANTKGRGCDTGKFIGANVLNEAFLERFSVTFEQDYPSSTTETKILTQVCESLGVDDVPIDTLIRWAGLLRSSYNQGDIDEVITTRRLINICKACSIWGSTQKAIELCTNRFDDDTKKSFREFYNKVAGEPDDELSELNQDVACMDKYRELSQRDG